MPEIPKSCEHALQSRLPKIHWTGGFFDKTRCFSKISYRITTTVLLCLTQPLSAIAVTLQPDTAKALFTENVNSTRQSPNGNIPKRGNDTGSMKIAMFERFTEKAIMVIMLAQEESRSLGHNYVGTEQILLGLIGEDTGAAAKSLKSMGVNLKDARIEVEKIIGRGSGFIAVEMPFTPGAKRVLELSLEEARQLGHNYIGTEHLLLGLIREGEGVGAKVLKNLGMDLDLSVVRTQVIQMLQ